MPTTPALRRLKQEDKRLKAAWTTLHSENLPQKKKKSTASKLCFFTLYLSVKNSLANKNYFIKYD
jgi:hypothetical protein